MIQLCFAKNYQIQSRLYLTFVSIRIKYLKYLSLVLKKVLNCPSFPKLKSLFRNFNKYYFGENIYFDSDLVWRMIIKIQTQQEFLTFNAYQSNLSYQILVGFISVYQN